MDSLDIIEEPTATVLVSVHVFPAIFIKKLAVPLEVGVPVIFKVKFPDVAEKVPALKVAVKPNTLVDDALTAL